MTHDKKTAVAFTGHRHNRITTDINALSDMVFDTISDLYSDLGYRSFISGMAEGFDLIAAEQVMKLKRVHDDVRLIAVIPYRKQNNGFSDSDKRTYAQILRMADETVILSEGYYNGCFLRRNDYMLDNASYVVSYFNNHIGGGTYYTVQRAIQRDMPIKNLAQKEDLLFRVAGSGISVRDRRRMESGDYKAVARISVQLDVIFLDRNLSITAIAEINHFAKTQNFICKA